MSQNLNKIFKLFIKYIMPCIVTAGISFSTYANPLTPSVQNEPTGTYIYGGLTAIGGEVNIGYLFNPSIGLELGGGTATYIISDSSIIHLALVRNFSIGTRAQLTAKIGLAVANSELVLDSSNNSKLHPAANFGLGLNYFFNQNLSGGVNIDTAMYTEKNKDSGMNDDQFAVIPTIGLTYYFTKNSYN